MVLMEPWAQNFHAAERPLYRQHVEQLLNALRLLHTVGGYVHRDIRPANLMRVNATRALLIDLTFAVPVNTCCPYAGIFWCASDAVLGALSEQYDYEVAVTPQDDLHSFVRAFYIMTHPEVEQILPQASYGHCAKIKRFWSQCWQHSEIW